METFRIAQSYTRDAGGRITQKSETISAVTSAYTYGYDAAGRLTTVTKDGSPLSSYTYDSNSNRLTKTTATTTEVGTYDTQDRLLTYNSAAYAYTANGELQSKTDTSGTTTYSYDELGNLLSVTKPDGTLIEYVIDGQNRRTGKKVNGTLVKQWLYADALRIAAELDGSGNLVSRFVYATRSNVPDLMQNGGAIYRIVSDHLGSPRLVVNPFSGDIIERLDYDEFGNVTQDTNPGFQPFAFAGGLYDPDTKLVRLGARDYDASTGRWTARDPIELQGGDPNFYGYVFSDPVNAYDSSGLATIVGGDKSPYTQKLKNALDYLRSELNRNSTPKCDAYFQAQPNPAFKDFRKALLTEGGPPYIVAADRPRDLSSDVAAYSQKASPFEYMFIFKDFIDKNPIGPEVPSVILHELGHLAREDTTKNEPLTFFSDCKCGSINPGRQR